MGPFSGIETNEYRQADWEWAHVKCIISYVNLLTVKPATQVQIKRVMCDHILALVMLWSHLVTDDVKQRLI